MSELSANLQKGLVGHWTMDDRDTDNGMLRDRGASDNHGEINGATIGEEAPIGQSYSFDGEGDHVFLNNTPVDEFEAFTSGCWFKWGGDGGGSDGRNFLYETSPNWATNMFILESGEMQVDARSDGNTNGLTTGFYPDVGQWYHTLAVWDGEESTLKFYLDGEFESQRNTNDDGSTDSIDSMGIATHRNASNRWFDGEMSNLVLYDRALSESEIDALYNMRSQRNANV